MVCFSGGACPTFPPEALPRSTSPRMMKTLLAIDPGITTGIAYFRFDDEDGTFSLENAWTRHRAPQIIAADIILNNDNLEVVIEDLLGSGPRSEYLVTTLKLIGWLENFCLLENIPYELAAPQWRKSKLEEARVLLTQLSVNADLSRYDATDRPHMVDATAHGLAYIRRRVRGAKRRV